jgi:acylpyruvate hydrolase
VRLVTFIANNTTRLGVLIDGQVLDLPGAYTVWQQGNASSQVRASDQQPFPTSVLALLQAGETTRAVVDHVLAFAADPDTRAGLALAGLVFPIDTVTFLPPIPRPGKIVCLGHNYRRHIAEMGSPMPQYPVLFAKFATTLIGHRQPIVLPKVSNQVDYEAELALVIGRTGKDIPNTQAAFDYLAGYTIFNDVSVRDYQRRTVQWMQGKNFDGTGPIGPALVTVDEVHDPHALDMTLRLNGEVMQQTNTSDFIFDIPTMLSYISEIMTLEPGDIIATGTPSGVGYARSPQVFLRPGDVVQVEIAELGVLENPVIAAPGGGHTSRQEHSALSEEVTHD